MFSVSLSRQKLSIEEMRQNLNLGEMQSDGLSNMTNFD